MRIRLLREAGGLGDVVRCLGVARAIREAIPDAEVWFYTLAGYSEFVQLCPDVHRTVDVHRGERRARDATPDPGIHRYLRSREPFDATIDQYCPAFQHERNTCGAVQLDRIDVWHQTASRVLGIELEPRLAWLALPAELRGRAQGWLECHGLGRTQLVGIEIESVSVNRSWPDLQWAQVVREVRAVGAQVLVFHKDTRRGLAIAEDIGADGFACADLQLVTALVARCDLLLGVDSGLFHVAAAVGTPTVAVFGATNGYLMCRHYPRHFAIMPGPAESFGLPCHGRPCYRFPQMGFSRLCDQGCWAMNRIPAERVAAAAVARLVA